MWTTGATIVSGLGNIGGHVSGIRRMYEGDRYCVEVLDQISSERAELEAVALLFLDDHDTGRMGEVLESSASPGQPS